MASCLLVTDRTQLYEGKKNEAITLLVERLYIPPEADRHAGKLHFLQAVTTGIMFPQDSPFSQQDYPLEFQITDIGFGLLKYILPKVIIDLVYADVFHRNRIKQKTPTAP